MIASLVEDIDSRCELKIDVFDKLTVKEFYDLKLLVKRV